MIIWTIDGLTLWIAERLGLLTFYGILGLYFYDKHKATLQKPIKNLLYSLAFISLVVGVWEMPLFFEALQVSWIWVLNLILYMVPFPIICAIFRIHFSIGKREIGYFVAWCFTALIFVIVNLNTYLSTDVTKIALWDYDISFLMRAITFFFLYLIFKKMEIKT